MQTISATEAKQRFAAVLDAAQREPVRIQRHDRDVAVVISPRDFEQLRRLQVQELIRFTEETGRYAESQGMTDELLEQLLSEK